MTLHPRKAKNKIKEKLEHVPLGEIKADDREERVEKSLEAIYVDDRGRVPDLSRLTRRKSSWWARFALGFSVFSFMTAGLAWVGLVYGPTWFHKDTTAQAISLAIYVSPTVTLGKEETIQVDWKNEELASLTQADVRLAWPTEFTPTSFNPPPTDPATKRWVLGLVPAQGKGSITVKGVFTGSLGSQGVIQAISTYRRNPTQRDLEVVTSQPVAYGESVIEGALEVPEKIVAGDTVTLKYRLKNKGQIALKGLMVRLTLPERFLLTQPVFKSEDAMLFSLGDLAAGASTTFVAVGSFPSGVSGDMVFQGEVGQKSLNGSFLALQRNGTSVPVLAGDLALRLVVNGATGEKSIKPGDPLRVAVGYENISPETMKEVTFTLGFESVVNGKSATGTSLLRWSELDDSGKGATSTRPRIQTITYTSEQMKALGTILSQAEGSFEVSLPTLLTTSGTKDAVVVVSIQARVPTIGNTKVNRTIKTQPVTVRYQSDVEASSQARYYTEEGIPLGMGPLPPVVGKTTAYRIVWRLNKTLHPLEKTTMSAVLPARVEWNNRITAESGSVSYDAATRTVQWKLPNVPESIKEVEATFEVQLTPTSADAGRFASLLGETRFETTDPVAKTTIVQTKPGLNTDLQNDDGAKGKGVVRKE